MKLFYRISIFCAFIMLSCFLTWAITSWFYSNQNKELSQKQSRNQVSAPIVNNSEVEKIVVYDQNK